MGVPILWVFFNIFGVGRPHTWPRCDTLPFLPASKPRTAEQLLLRQRRTNKVVTGRGPPPRTFTFLSNMTRFGGPALVPAWGRGPRRLPTRTRALVLCKNRPIRKSGNPSGKAPFSNATGFIRNVNTPGSFLYWASRHPPGGERGARSIGGEDVGFVMTYYVQIARIIVFLRPSHPFPVPPTPSPRVIGQPKRPNLLIASGASFPASRFIPA